MTAPFPAAYRLTIKSDDRVVVEIVDESIVPLVSYDGGKTKERDYGLADWPTDAEIIDEVNRRFGDSVGRFVVGVLYSHPGVGLHESVYGLLFAPVE